MLPREILLRSPRKTSGSELCLDSPNQISNPNRNVEILFLFFYIFVFLDVFFTNQANYDTREGSKLCIIINLITKYNVVPSEHKQTNVVPARASSSIAIIRLWDKSKMESWTSGPDSWGSETRDGSDGYRPKPVQQTSINLN